MLFTYSTFIFSFWVYELSMAQAMEGERDSVAKWRRKWEIEIWARLYVYVLTEQSDDVCGNIWTQETLLLHSVRRSAVVLSGSTISLNRAANSHSWLSTYKISIKLSRQVFDTLQFSGVEN